MVDILGGISAPFQSLAGGVSSGTSPNKQSANITGVGRVGGSQGVVEGTYQQALGDVLGLRQREKEAELFAQQAERLRQAGMGTMAATEAAREQARAGGATTMGAARSQAGVAGVQTAALGALGAGQAQQFGMQAAGQVAAEEAQRNALAQAQMADLLRRQALAQYGLERADIATELGAGRALLAPEIELRARYGQEEARRQQQLFAGGMQAAGSGGGYLLNVLGEK